MAMPSSASASAWVDELDIDDSDILQTFNNSSSRITDSGSGDGAAPTRSLHRSSLHHHHHQNNAPPPSSSSSAGNLLLPLPTSRPTIPSSSSQFPPEKLQISSSSASCVLRRFQKPPPPSSSSHLQEEVSDVIACRKRLKEHQSPSPSPPREEVNTCIASRKRIKDHPSPSPHSCSYPSSSSSFLEEVNEIAQRKLIKGHHPSTFPSPSPKLVSREYISDVRNVISLNERKNPIEENQHGLQNKENYNLPSVNGCVEGFSSRDAVHGFEAEGEIYIHDNDDGGEKLFSSKVRSREDFHYRKNWKEQHQMHLPPSPKAICREIRPDIVGLNRSKGKRNPFEIGYEENQHGLPSVMCKENHVLSSVEGPRYPHNLEEEEDEIQIQDNEGEKSFPSRNSRHCSKHIPKQVSGQGYSLERKSSFLQKENNVMYEGASQISKRNIVTGMPKQVQGMGKVIQDPADKMKFSSVQTSLPTSRETREHSPSSDYHTSPQRGLPYTIPGPAGAVQRGIVQQAQQCSTYNGRTKENYRGRGSIADDSDFRMTAWLNAMKYIEKSSLSVSTISSVKTSRTENRVPKLVTVIKTCSPNGCGDIMVTLKDKTGCIAGTVNRRVMVETEFGRLVEPGAVMLLHQVAVFSPTPYAHYLNITINNVEQVFGNSQEFQYEDEASHARNKEQAYIGSKHDRVFVDESSQFEPRMVELYAQTTRGKQMGNKLPEDGDFTSEVASKAICSAPENDVYDQLLDDTDIFQCLQLGSAVI